MVLGLGLRVPGFRVEVLARDPTWYFDAFSI